MPTQITILDKYDNNLELNDIVLINYPNPNYFFIGMLGFNFTSFQFEVSDCRGKAIPLNHSTSTSVEKLCTAATCKATIKHFGVHDLKGGKVAAKKRDQIISAFKLKP